MNALMFLVVYLVFLCVSVVVVSAIFSHEEAFVTCALNAREFGDQLSQMSAAFALGRKLKKPVVFPHWKYDRLFIASQDIAVFRDLDVEHITQTKPERSDFDLDFFSTVCTTSVKVTGNRRDPRYFAHTRHDLRRLWTLSSNAVQKYACKMPAIGVLMTSDESQARAVEWCQSRAAKDMPVLRVNESTDPEEAFAILRLCPWKVLSESRLGWWAAWLDSRTDTHVLAPKSMANRLATWRVFDERGVSDLSVSSPLIRIGAYYQSFRRPRAFANVCQSFREIYPDASLVIVSDNGDDFRDLALTRFRATSYTSNTQRVGNGVTTCAQSLEQIKLFVRNFIRGARQMSEVWFILLEDDVYVDHALRVPNPIDDDVVILGNNNRAAVLGPSVLALLGQKEQSQVYYGGCGGSLFRTSFWANLSEGVMNDQLDLFATRHTVFHSDVVLSFLTYSLGKQVLNAQDMYPSEFSETRPKIGQDVPAVTHQFKEWY